MNHFIAKSLEAIRLSRLLRKTSKKTPGSLVRCLNYTVCITDGPNFYMQFKDEFIRRIYDFQALREDPFIIDGGSNIGMSILYFKHRYPKARVIGFEPDPNLFRILQENVLRNRLKDVKLINSALGERPGMASFNSDGSAGGRLEESKNNIAVRVECLSDYLKEKVDFVKLNIEGEELPVLQETANKGQLRNVREFVIEYHGWAGGKQSLGHLLNLLDQEGFRYLIHDFDPETCPTTKPPFRWTPETVWFCLIYARRIN